ncbi:MAG TPA: tetraacyldisaccharide 4'-kinase [Rhodanobacteraceae bacterium]|jgi:tetraacyldisaccharide 4'-kinase|nr:tetraacyldisaccharide 4'-kinase [Rhodanobacteraceae bacterium]
MSMADHLQQRWYEDRAPPAWTLPVAALYGGVVRLRRRLYRSGVLRSQRLAVPVVVVGNVTAGGAGKTPLVIALVSALRERGRKPGVVSRGYGGSTREPRLLDREPDQAEVGDEPALIAIRTGAPVAVGADRPAAARLLLDQGVDVIVADDGLQHYALARDIEICVVDGTRRLGNERLLPAGPLREPTSRLRRVDFVVCNGGKPREGEIPMALAPVEAVGLDQPSRRQSLASFANRRVHAVAGIGHPGRFFQSLREAGVEPIEHPFPDHHRYAPADLAFGDELPVLMTDKDAVKCRAFARQDWWRVPVTAALPKSFLDAVAERLPRPANGFAAPQPRS